MVSGYKNQKPESLPSNLQKSAHQKTLNLKRNIKMLVLLNQGKALTAYWSKSAKRLKKWNLNYASSSIHSLLNNKQKMPIRYALNTKIENQKQVAEILVNYFSSIASNIGGNHVASLSESKFNDHSSIQMTETVYNNSIFQIKRVNTEDVQVFWKPQSYKILQWHWING